MNTTMATFRPAPPGLLLRHAQQSLGGDNIVFVSVRERDWSTVMQVADTDTGQVWWVKNLSAVLPQDPYMIPSPSAGNPHLPAYSHVETVAGHLMWISEDCGPLLHTLPDPVPVLEQVVEALPALHAMEPAGGRERLEVWDVERMMGYVTSLPELSVAEKVGLGDLLEPLQSTGVCLVNTDVHPGNISHAGVVFDWSDAFLTYPTAGLHWLLVHCEAFVGLPATVELLQLYAETVNPSDPGLVLRDIVPGSAAAVLLRNHIFKVLAEEAGATNVDSQFRTTLEGLRGFVNNDFRNNETGNIHEIVDACWETLT